MVWYLHALKDHRLRTQERYSFREIFLDEDDALLEVFEGPLSLHYRLWPCLSIKQRPSASNPGLSRLQNLSRDQPEPQWIAPDSLSNGQDEQVLNLVFSPDTYKYDLYFTKVCQNWESDVSFKL